MALSRQSDGGKLVRVRHGAYAEALDADNVARHRQLIAATWPIVGQGTVLSHVSAGVLHGLPAWASMLGRVTVIRTGTGHGGTRTHLHARRSPLDPSEVTMVDGYRVTSLERTAVDLACLLSYERAVAVMDAALRAGALPETLTDSLAAARHRHGIGRAKAASSFADRRAESPAESISRVRMAQVGLACPELQVNVFDEFGHWVARTDFAWIERGVLGEFDGAVKYRGTPDEVARAVMAEKAREARIRKLGWVLVRWSWADLLDPVAFRTRIEAAFEQASGVVRGHVELT